MSGRQSPKSFCKGLHRLPNNCGEAQSMGDESSNNILGRRSDRVSIAFPVVVSGIDSTGKHFTVETRTDTVSRYGCCVHLPRLLPRDQEVFLRRSSDVEPVTGRVVAQLGRNSNRYLYGVGTPKSCENLWGIRFSAFSVQEKLMDSMYEGVYTVNRDRIVTLWNLGAQQLAGYSSTEALGQTCSAGFLGHVDATGKPLCGSNCPLDGVMADGQAREIRAYLRHKEGHRVPVGVRVLPILNRVGTITGATQVFSDAGSSNATEQRVSELENLAFRDPLTNLPNRRYLESKVTQALDDYQQFGRQYGLLLLDLDRFKQINDSHGHDVGDAVLKAVGETLVRSLRAVDVVGRWGGEEFLVLLTDAVATAMGDLTERCRVLIAQSSVSQGASRVSVTASIGATVFGPNDSTATAIRRADDLMYKSKRSGGNRTTIE